MPETGECLLAALYPVPGIENVCLPAQQLLGQGHCAGYVRAPPVYQLTTREKERGSVCVGEGQRVILARIVSVTLSVSSTATV